MSNDMYTPANSCSDVGSALVQLSPDSMIRFSVGLTCRLAWSWDYMKTHKKGRINVMYEIKYLTLTTQNLTLSPQMIAQSS